MALAIVGFVAPVFFYFHYRASNSGQDSREASFRRYPKPRLEIKGFRYEGNHDGQKVISIRADKFSIQKKKLGFFRFGLMNEARLANAYIHLYGRSGQTENSEVGGRSGQTEKRSDGYGLQRNLTFKGIFSKDVFPSFPVKKISSIVMQPVCLELHDEKTVVAKISADSAAIRLKRRDILFQGNVKVVSGTRVLNTDRLSLRPESAVIQTNRPFMLKTPEKQYEGQGLITDIFLTLKR